MEHDSHLPTPYTIETLVDEVPISDGSYITCCEYFDTNLYIGTSSSEILHFVSIRDDSSDRAQFILASRLEPTAPSTDNSQGVQQIVVLSSTGKACILCNGTLTFHSLPELSPAGSRKVSGCLWVGGKDLNVEPAGDPDDGSVLVICTRKRIRLIRIGDEVQVIKNIEYPDCQAVARRGNFACVADSQSYALLDVENQQKIPLFPISSIDETARPAAAKQVFNIHGDSSARSGSPHPPRIDSIPAGKAHGRASSLDQFVGGLRLGASPEPSPSRSSMDVPESGIEAPSTAASRPEHDPRSLSPSGRMPNPPVAESSPRAAPTKGSQLPGLLKPHVVSLLPSEFLVTVGTDPSGPAMGMFVNCDGDVSRGNLNFGTYPCAVAVDRGSANSAVPMQPGDSESSYVLAAMTRRTGETSERGVEVHSSSGKQVSSSWLSLAGETQSADDFAEGAIGVAAVENPFETRLSTIGEKLSARKFWPKGRPSEELTASAPEDQTRLRQEEDFAKRLGVSSSRIMAWEGRAVKLLLRAPMVEQLDASVDGILQSSRDPPEAHANLRAFLLRIRSIEPRSEAEYLSLEYVRQKTSVILLTDLLVHRSGGDSRFQEELFLAGDADPRIVLSLIPLLQEDIFEAPNGMWIHAGLVRLMTDRYAAVSIALDPDEVLSRPEDVDALALLKWYLMAWRQRKGFGSIADEAQVFSTVDAALLHVLLFQDQQSKLGPGGSSSLRAELYALVDSGIDCLEHAVVLLEEYGRLYVLSRLYQSRRMSAKVLETWRRILDGEKDMGGELTDGENEMRKYLTKRGNAALVEDYGVWLAQRNAPLGVEVFTDSHSKIQLPPRRVVQILHAGAPDAVKVYLEQLVFVKKDIKYANDLITFYLDSVLGAIDSSVEAKSILSESYEAYRALQAPKPTYRDFISDNSVAAPWWGDRFRLLELLGGTYGSAFSYDVAAVLGRIAPFEDALVPESIILEGRQGHHEQALHLLTHGMGDYHTAVNYCLLGGSSIFHPASGSVHAESARGFAEQATLFRHLLSELLRLEDEQVRLEQTGQLLGRFGTWFDVQLVLESIPTSWPVESIAAFLCTALRRLLQQRNEALVTKALRGLESTKTSSEFIEKCGEFAPKIVPAMDTPTSM